METKHGDILRTQESVDETPKQESLINYEKIKDTPFTLVHQNDDWFIIMGNHKITTPTKTKEETLEKLKTEKWFIILTIAAIVESVHHKLRTHKQNDELLEQFNNLPEVK